MNFLSYVLLGGLSYAAGWIIRTKVLDQELKPQQPYNLKHPTVIGFMAGFFIVMMIVSWLIGRYILGHIAIDLAFIIINSLVATFVFSFGLNPERAQP